MTVRWPDSGSCTATSPTAGRVDSRGSDVAKGLINYPSTETDRILGCNSDEIESRLGYVEEPELVHRDNMVLV